MDYGVTDKGFIVKPFEKILEDMQEDWKKETGQDVSITPDSVLGQLFNVIAAPTKDVWDLGESITSTQDIDEASGQYLDKLAYSSNLITRNKESGSKGDILFTGSQGTIIPTLTVVKDFENRNVITTESITLNRANCYTSTFDVKILEDNEDYTINVEGTEITITSSNHATKINILEALELQIKGNTSVNAEIVEEKLLLTFPSFNNLLTTTNSDNLTLYSLGSLVGAESADKGDVNFKTNTLVNLVSSILGVTSVTNPKDFENGRKTETDEELRARIKEGQKEGGAATLPAIQTSLLLLDGVTTVDVISNETLTDDVVTGVPAKSFETFISGGDEDVIAETIFKTKATLELTHGDITKIVVDNNGDNRVIKFSRPTTKYAWIRITYVINQEEVFPANGEELIRNSVLSFGNNMDQGEDLEPTKFYAPCYQTRGVFISKIEVALTDTEVATPSYQETRIPVSKTEALVFDSNRIVITT